MKLRQIDFAINKWGEQFGANCISTSATQFVEGKLVIEFF